MTLEAERFDTSRDHNFNQQNSSDRTSNLTPGITRRPECLGVDDRRRVGGRVHAVVSWRVR